jgi:hypothetical protein
VDHETWRCQVRGLDQFSGGSQERANHPLA